MGYKGDFRIPTPMGAHFYEKAYQAKLIGKAKISLLN